ncbi:MAG: hypothetical protein RLZZ374_1597, partial [Cyanobacteriota bacterium]
MAYGGALSALLGLGLQGWALPLAALAAPRVGVWLTNSPSPLYYDAGRLDRAVDELAEAGFNTLYPNVWSRGTTFHASRWAPMEPALRQANGGLDPICRLTQAAQRRGLQVIPWFEYGLMEPAEAEVVRQHPEWVLQKRDGTSLTTMHGRNDRVWLNPAHPGVRQRFIGLISEIVQRCGVDGIQLDDHFAWPVELGYDAYTRELYAKDTGLQPPDNYTDRAWMKWRRHRLSDLLAELRESLKQIGKGRVYVSLSPGPFRFAYNNWLQDWEIWALGGQIEELVVQNYAYSRPAGPPQGPHLGHPGGDRHPGRLRWPHHVPADAARQGATGKRAGHGRDLLLLGRPVGPILGAGRAPTAPGGLSPDQWARWDGD